MRVSTLCWVCGQWVPCYSPCSSCAEVLIMQLKHNYADFQVLDLFYLIKFGRPLLVKYAFLHCHSKMTYVFFYCVCGFLFQDMVI